MKNIAEIFYEGRRKKEDVNVSENEKVEKGEKKWGKNARLKWSINPPTDNDASKDVNTDTKSYNKNMKKLLAKFRTEEDFFIIGRAGWGKTSIINSLAKKHGYEVVCVYLDKAVASDLGGVPVPMKGNTERVKAKQEMAMPEWASYILEHPEKDFLLFFDEMNQAAPDVMNALMPIVLEHQLGKEKCDNFFVGAAGNFESENSAVNELSGPLRSRFKPIIEWQTNDDASWKQAFEFLHKKWDDNLTKEVVDKFEENANLFENPREIDMKILQFMFRLKVVGEYDEFDASDYCDRLEGLCRDGLSRTEQDQLKELGEFMYEYMNDKLKTQKSGGRQRMSIDMVPESIIKAIKQGMERGYIDQQENGKRVRYGISKENIYTLIEETECNAEMAERIIQKFLDDGIKFKFETNKEWRDEGYKDPDED